MAIGQLISQGVQNLHNRFSSDRNYNFARQQFSDQKLYADTYYRRAVADLKEAGLNPMLAVTSGMHSSSPSSVTAGGGSGTASSNASEAYSAASVRKVQEKLMTEQMLNLQAERDRTKAEADEIRARTPVHGETAAEIRARIPTHGQSIQVMKQNIAESAKRIERIIEETNVQAHTAQEIKQRTVNLKETVPQIRATVEQLRTLSQQQTATTQQTRQRIKQDLPALEAQMRRLENYAKELQQPGREQESSAQQGFIGALGAVLRILNPLRGLMP